MEGTHQSQRDGPVLSFSPLVMSVLTVTLLITAWFYYRNKKSSRNKFDQDWAKELASSKSSPIPPELKIKDVWEERRQKGIASSASCGERGGSVDRPFGSSYYYAHNNPNATGGYKDGLRMEDYTMNQPRLLSKSSSGAVPEGDSKDSSMSDPNINVTKEPSSDTTSAGLKQRKRVLPPPPSREEGTIKISKFLWDDPGDAKGIGTIRIDTLPTKSGKGEPLTWQDAHVETIDASLVDDNRGLLVVVRTQDGTNYRLHIPKLYGPVEAVKPVSKSKRLLVRLYKKRKNQFYVTDKKNLQAWPHP